MAPKDLGPGAFGPDDIQPIDLEPAYPGDWDDPNDRAERPRREPGGRRSWWWLAVAGAGVAAWVAIALTTAGSHPRPTTTPTSVPFPGVGQTVTPSGPAIDKLAPILETGLRGIGSGRFAVVVEDHLYLLSTAPAATGRMLVALPDGDVTIADQNGASLLATTFHQTLVSTEPENTRTLADDEVAIRAAVPDGWVLLRADGTISDDRGDRLASEPAGVRVAAVVDGGFVAVAAPDSRWVMWSTSTSTTTTTTPTPPTPSLRTIAPPGYQLLAAGPREMVFKSGCGYNGCTIEIVDLHGQLLATNRLASIPQFAAFSPDGTRLALASTQGNVDILDTRTGLRLPEMGTTFAQQVSLPFSWTPDGQDLIVVGNEDVQIRRATDGLLTSDITGAQSVEQLVSLP